MLKLLVDTIRRSLNTKKQSKGSPLHIDQKIYIKKEREKNEDYSLTEGE